MKPTFKDLVKAVINEDELPPIRKQLIGETVEEYLARGGKITGPFPSKDERVWRESGFSQKANKQRRK